MLGWAARLHEVGHAVSHAQYHKHGAYLLRYADLAGFSRQEQQLLASLVRGHRRKFPLAEFDALSGTLPREAAPLCVCLRLSVVLHRGRTDAPPPGFTVAVDGSRIALRFEPGWLEAHPLTRADLDQEAEWLAAAGFRLTFT